MTLNESEARYATAHWISAADPELCRFATGHDRNAGSEVDWPEFLAELDACRPYAGSVAGAHAELDALADYARGQLDVCARGDSADDCYMCARQIAECSEHSGTQWSEIAADSQADAERDAWADEMEMEP